MRTCCPFLLLPLPVSAPSRPVPFRPTPGTLCNHKVKARKVSERDEEQVGPVLSLTVAERVAFGAAAFPASVLPLYGRCCGVEKAGGQK